MPARRVLVADRDALARWPMAEQLRAAGFDVVEARTAADAVAHVAGGLDLAFVDEALGEEDGAPVLASAALLDPDLTLVAMRGADALPAQPHLSRTPVFECITKPVVLSTLVDSAARGADVTRLRRDLRAAREASAPPVEIVGESAAMDRVRALVQRYATSVGSSVLVTGEPGVGKRAVARRIHEAGARATSPFVLLTCAAMPGETLEPALFGVEAGAGRPRRPGAFEIAREGTLALASVEAVPLELQARVLQVLEAGTFRRAGGTLDVATGVRVIATSTADLEARVRAGSFRGDLFYRLSALRVDVAPLRARRQDVPALADHLARQVARELDWPEPDGVRTAGTTLDRHAWPGNVRELRLLVTHALLLRGRDAHGPLDLTEALSALHDPSPARGRNRGFTLPPEGVSLEDVERGLVIQALARTGGNQTKAAALLSLHRDQMRYRIEKFGLKT